MQILGKTYCHIKGILAAVLTITACRTAIKSQRSVNRGRSVSLSTLFLIETCTAGSLLAVKLHSEKRVILNGK